MTTVYYKGYNKEMSKQDLMVSVVCTVFNKENWIKQTIDSILSQKTKFNFEIILIDDASTDASAKILKDYSDKNNNIKTIFNKKNMGITKTWIKACKFATGKYIARCDGDDYWIDDHKLQKQVDALEATSKSKWSNTDYNIVDVTGKTISESAFRNKVTILSDSYEHMLSSKGFTAPSTWLIETKLMNQINTIIDKNTVDDTFNIQLELFQKTKLTYLTISTTAYRIGHESVSHIIDPEKAKNRINKLLKTQLEYLNKYKTVSLFKIAKFAFQNTATIEEVEIDLNNKINKLQKSIENQNKTIENQNKTIDSIINSRSYTLAKKAASLNNRIRLSKPESK